MIREVNAALFSDSALEYFSIMVSKLLEYLLKFPEAVLI